MAITSGSKIAASDLSGVLTKSNFLSSIDLDALKEALGVSVNTSAAKVVGTAKSISNATITLTTSDWDYAVVTSYPSTIVRNDASLSASDYYGYGMEDAPTEFVIWNNTTTYAPIFYDSSFIYLNNTTFTASGATITDPSNMHAYCHLSIVLYKNS